MNMMPDYTYSRIPFNNDSIVLILIMVYSFESVQSKLMSLLVEVWASLIFCIDLYLHIFQSKFKKI